jgi:hypothetical protein
METDFAKAWREWQDSEEGKRCLNGATIKLPLNQQRYFENRLFLAFSAGHKVSNAISAGDTNGT